MGILLSEAKFTSRDTSVPIGVHRHVSAVAGLFALLAIATAAGATEPPPAESYKPVPGQAGKDVVWVPTPQDTVRKMLDLARVTQRDFVIDLGSGDGRNVIEAAKRGARALGVEYNPDLVALSKRAAAAAGVSDNAAFVHGDMFEADISQATVLLLFLLPAHLSRLAPKFLALQPGTRIVSNTYGISGWEPDETARGEPCLTWCIVHLYVVPARVAGTWQMADGATLTLDQRYQRLSGTLHAYGVELPLEDARLDGAEIRFTANRVRYEGRVRDGRMDGIAHGRAKRAWSASRE